MSNMTWLRLLLVLAQLYLCLLLAGFSSTHLPMGDDTVETVDRPKHVLLDLQVCNVSSFEIPNQPFPFELEYQCSGPLYDDFTSRLAKFESDADRHGDSWGRRSRVLPPNTTVLFLGNSHTKQTHNQLTCQYSKALIGFEGLHAIPDSTGSAVSDYTSYVLRFRENVSIYLVYNSPVEIAKDWQRRLESIVRRPLSSFDAVVLGQFNGAGKDIHNTSYYRRMKNWTLTEEGDAQGRASARAQAGTGATVDPPNVIRLAEAYHGPIVFVSNYDVGKESSASKIVQVMDEMSTMGRRSKLVGIMSRRYIAELGGNECGTDVRQTNASTVPDCGVKYSRSHRCVGKAGGHPTLIAHDIQEALFSVLK